MRIFRFLKIVLLSTSVFTLSGCRKTALVNNAYIYLVVWENINFGSITGEQWQSVSIGSYSKEVTAVPKTGYVFTHWSDGNTNPKRKDMAVVENVNGPIYFYAYFEAE